MKNDSLYTLVIYWNSGQMTKYRSLHGATNDFNLRKVADKHKLNYRFAILWKGDDFTDRFFGTTPEDEWEKEYAEFKVKFPQFPEINFN